jgi:hypothetical protein
MTSRRDLYYAQVQSWTTRAGQRGAGMVVFRPPPGTPSQVRWHVVALPDGTEMRLQFHPGIDVWRDSDGQRWNAEALGALNARYVRPSKPSDEKEKMNVPAARTIIKLQCPLNSPALDWLAYNKSRTVNQFIPRDALPASVQKAMADRQKGYFDAVIGESGAIVFGNITHDQSW